MLRIAVVDDEVLVIETLKTLLTEFYVSRSVSFSISTYQSGEELLQNPEHMDIVLLDIQMEGMDGIETAQELREKDKKTVLFYITNFQNEMLRTFSVHPFAFIPKPIDRKLLYTHLQDHLVYYQETSERFSISVHAEHGTLILFVEDILYLEYISNRRIRVVTNDKDYMIIGTMIELFAQLEAYHFIKPHKSFIVNLSKIHLVAASDIIIENGDKIPIAQKKISQVVMQISSYLHNHLEGM